MTAFVSLYSIASIHCVENFHFHSIQTRCNLQPSPLFKTTGGSDVDDKYEQSRIVRREMKLASLRKSGRDGELVVVSRDMTRAVPAAEIAPTMQVALEDWDLVADQLGVLYRRLNDGEAIEAFAFEPQRALAPLPRSHQFVDASAFLNHGDIMEKAYGLTVKKTEGIPILLQRQGDAFADGRSAYPFPDENDQCDFEGEFAVIVGDIPMGSSASFAAQQIRLVTMFNDVSMRKHLSRELAMGFGFINAKPAPAFGPVAVTPDELGSDWADGRVALDMCVFRNGELFGKPNGREMDWSFGEILAHLAYNRDIRAGTILGSGTVSNRDYQTVGSACLAERRAIETITHGSPSTDFIAYGETLTFEPRNSRGEAILGKVEHTFVRHGA